MGCLLLAALFNQLEAGEMRYEKNKVVLSQDVKWEHPFGLLVAKSAEACMDEKGVSREIIMQEGMEIEFREGGVLSAPYAWIGCRQWAAVFQGHAGQKINFRKNNQALNSLRMEFKFLPPGSMDQIIAEESVEMQSDPGFRFFCDKAIFKGFSENKDIEKVFAFSKGVPCRLEQVLEDGQINKIDCESAELDLKKQIGSLEGVSGELQQQGVALHFKAKKMAIDRIKDELIFQPPVFIRWLGTLEASGAVKILKKNGKLHTVLVDGPAILKWKENTVKVFGSIDIDAVVKEAVLTSPAVFGEDEQIRFSDPEGEIFADQATLLFEEVEKEMKVSSVSLKGNVRLINKKLGSAQYALADEAIIDFEKQIVTLQATRRPRVLFFDELNKIQASASGLVINRNPATGQERVKGIGNTRFVFAEDELNELKKRFSFEPRK